MNAPWPGRGPEGRLRPLRLLHTRGTLRVTICRLCAAVIVVAGAAQHEQVHHVEGPRNTV